tara:strand:- start:293 stop:706 length:414 start_codon:yes stop_codon:yes gene_type:complete
MFSKKFNPDITNSYNHAIKKRDKDKFKLKDIPYKNIINDNLKNIKSSKELIVEINDDNSKINENYNNILDERKVKQIKNKNNVKLKEEIMSEYVKEEHELLKEEFKTQFENEKKELQNIKSSYNSLVESLINDGLLD